MKIIKAEFKDAKFIYDNLEILRGSVKYSFEKFSIYFQSYLLNENNWIYIGKIDNKYAGFVTVNLYSSIKYIGYTAELEEVVVVADMRGKGVGKLLLKNVLPLIDTNMEIRKIVVKTDDLNIAGKLYSKELDLTEMRVFQKYLNKI